MRTLASLVVAFLLAACGSVDSRAPLSDAKTTTLDEGLIGYWMAAAPKAADEAPAMFVIGRHATARRHLEFGALGLGDQDRIEVWRFELRATELAGRRYLSYRNEEDREKGYGFVGYALEGEDLQELWLYTPDVARFARAVLDGELKGEVEGDDKDLALRKVHLAEDTPALRRWFEAHADEAFERAEKPLRRLRPPTQESERDASPPSPPPPPATER